MEEFEIRATLLRHLEENTPDVAIIQEEFRIEGGRARIDVSVIESELIGYEIKSDKDSFARFPNQIHAYNRVFDRIYLVCGPTHAKLAEDVVPSWWGLIVAERDRAGGIVLNMARDASVNPKQDPFSLASLLWKDEAIGVLTSEQQDIPKRATSHTLWEHIATRIPVEKIKDAVTETLLKRQDYKQLAVKTI